MNKIFFIIRNNLGLLLFLFPLTVCSAECYKTPLQLKAKYENCTELKPWISPITGKLVRTFVCTTSGDDIYADFIEKDGKLCRSYNQAYK